MAQLDLFVNGEITLIHRNAILADLFGEQTAGDAVLAFAERMGRMKDLGQRTAAQRPRAISSVSRFFPIIVQAANEDYPLAGLLCRRSA